MPEGVPDNLALAVGELKGAVSGLVTMLENQNKSSSEFRKEIMDIFKGMREDNAKQAVLLAEHIKDDTAINNAVVQLMTWKIDAIERMDDAEKKISDLWDTKNKQGGFIAAMVCLGAATGGVITAIIEWWRH